MCQIKVSFDLFKYHTFITFYNLQSKSFTNTIHQRDSDKLFLINKRNYDSIFFIVNVVHIVMTRKYQK